MKEKLITVLVIAAIIFGILKAISSYDNAMHRQYTIGYLDGKMEGYDEGYKDGYDAGYDDGYYDGLSE